MENHKHETKTGKLCMSVFSHLSNTTWLVTCPVTPGTIGIDNVLSMREKTSEALNAGKISQREKGSRSRTRKQHYPGLVRSLRLRNRTEQWHHCWVLLGWFPLEEFRNIRVEPFQTLAISPTSKWSFLSFLSFRQLLMHMLPVTFLGTQVNMDLKEDNSEVGKLAWGVLNGPRFLFGMGIGSGNFKIKCFGKDKNASRTLFY